MRHGRQKLKHSFIMEHYSRHEVQAEIERFSRNRWVGIHCMVKMRDGRPLLLRYDRQKPLSIEKAADVGKLIARFEGLGPRTIYATANVYSKIVDRFDISSAENIISCMPTWDIDNTLDNWRATIEAAIEIRSYLEKKGVKSIVTKWSGKGIHVHVHQNAFSEGILKRVHPLDVAYSMVEYVNTNLRTRFDEIRSRMRSRELKIDNEMDQQRLFTSPLSLHRELPMVAVVLDPEKVESFHPSYANPSHFKHYYDWDRGVPGEADNLAIEAIEARGGHSFHSFNGMPTDVQKKR